MWDLGQIADALADGLRARAAELDAEDSVYGLDAMSELDLHPVLRNSLSRAGFGVIREQPYAGDPWSRPKESARDRCDIVLTPNPDTPLADDALEIKERDKAGGTLFEASVRDQPLVAQGLAPEDAFWLEIKTVGQHSVVAGVAGANQTYASALLACRGDLAKLSGDDRIRFGALCVVLFAEDEPIARHDLDALLHKCLDEDLPVSAPSVRVFGITERIGNTVTAVLLAPVRLL